MNRLNEKRARFNYYHEAISELSKAIWDGDAKQVGAIGSWGGGLMNERGNALESLCEAILELMDEKRNLEKELEDCYEDLYSEK